MSSSVKSTTSFSCSSHPKSSSNNNSRPFDPTTTSSYGHSPSAVVRREDRPLLASESHSFPTASVISEPSVSGCDTVSMQVRDQPELQVWKTPLVGRSLELDLLQTCLQEHMTTKQPHAIWVGGESGSGKTRLAESLLLTVDQEDALIVRGKFDFLLRDEPYAGIISACQDMAEHVWQLADTNTEKYSQVVQNLQQEIDLEELQLLVQVVPFLEFVLGKHLARMDEPASHDATVLSVDHKSKSTNSIADSNAQTAVDGTKGRFQETFRRFLRVVCRCFRPCIFLLDDLQWSDPSSLELLQELFAMDNIDTSIFWIFLYRSDEVSLEVSPQDSSLQSQEQRQETSLPQQHSNHHSLLQKTFQVLQEQQQAGKLGIHQISLANLTEASVNQFLQSLLQMSQEQVQPFARICHERTHGNIFFLISFLQMLHHHDYLTFAGDKWQWDEQEIAMRTQLTENVVDLLLQRMNQVSLDDPTISRYLLPLAACLGSTWNISVLEIVWNKLLGPTLSEAASHNGSSTPSCNKSGSSQSLRAGIDRLLREGFFRQVDQEGNSFQWAHDKVQEAALLLTPEQERATFHRSVGEAMADGLSSKDFDSLLFVIAHLINQGGMPSDLESTGSDGESKRVQFARLNLEASERALSIAAFPNAIKYAEKGIWYLPDDKKWDVHKDLCHDLYMNLIQAERVCCEFSSMELHCAELIEAHKNDPISTKLGAYYNQLKGVFMSDPKGKGLHTIELAFQLLDQLGCRFPKSKLGIQASTLKGVLYLKKIRRKLAKANRKINLEPMTEPLRIVQATEILNVLTETLYLAKDPRWPLVIIRYIKYTFEYGVTSHAPSVFAAASAVFTGGLNDLQGGALFANFALQLNDQVRYRPDTAGTIMISYSLGLMWTMPMKDVASQMMVANDFGLRTGETDHSATSRFQALNYHIFLGKALKDLEMECSSLRDQNKRDNNPLGILYNNFILFMLLSLQGEDTTEVTESIKQSPQGAINYEDPVSEQDHFCVFWTRTLLSSYMGDFETCAALSLAHKESVNTAFPGSPASMMDVMVRGVSCMVVARQTRMRPILREAKRLRKVIKDWKKQGNPNVFHFDVLMDAELAAIRKKHPREVNLQYEHAIKLALDSGCIHDAALFCECWGIYALESLKDQGAARCYLQRSINLYESWGATARAEALIKKYTSKLTWDGKDSEKEKMM